MASSRTVPKAVLRWIRAKNAQRLALLLGLANLMTAERRLAT